MRQWINKMDSNVLLLLSSVNLYFAFYNNCCVNVDEFLYGDCFVYGFCTVLLCLVCGLVVQYEQGAMNEQPKYFHSKKIFLEADTKFASKSTSKGGPEIRL